MLVIGEDGEQLGVLSKEDALKKAFDEDLDLVEVAPNANPPVCRIMNFGKYKYEQQKKQQQAKKKSQGMDLKELRLGRSTQVEQHDLDFKLKKAYEILQKGHRLQVFMQLRGREMAHSEMGIELLSSFAADLDEISKIEQGPRMFGKRINMLLTPLSDSAKKKKKEEKTQEKKKAQEEKEDEDARKLEREQAEKPSEGNSLADEAEEAF